MTMFSFAGTSRRRRLKASRAESMMDPDFRQQLEQEAAARRLRGRAAVDEIRALIDEKRAEIDGLKRMANTFAARAGADVPYPLVGEAAALRAEQQSTALGPPEVTVVKLVDMGVQRQPHGEVWLSVTEMFCNRCKASWKVSSTVDVGAADRATDPIVYRAQGDERAIARARAEHVCAL